MNQYPVEQSPFRANIWKMYTIGFLRHMLFASAVLVPFFTEWGKISFSQILILQSWFLVWGFILEIPTGTIADVFGRKTSLILGGAANIIAVILYTQHPSFEWFLAAEFFWGMSSALFSGADNALTYDSLKEIKNEKESKQIFSRQQSIGLIGILGGTIIGGFMAAQQGVVFPMLASIIPFGLATMVALTLKEPPIHTRGEPKDYLKTLKEGILYFKNHKTLRVLATDSIIITTIAYFILWMNQPLLQQAGVSIAFFGLVHASYILSQIAVLNRITWLEKIVGSRKKYITISALILGIMLIIMGIGGILQSTPLILLGIILGGGFGLSRKTYFNSIYNKNIPSEQRATILSTIAMFEKLSIATANLIVGILGDWSLNYTLILLGIIALIATFISKVEEEHLID